MPFFHIFYDEKLTFAAIQNVLMEVFKEIFPLKSYLKEGRKTGKSIGLVPTMGALHQGHLSLVDESLNEADLTVATIFVNPTQFNNADDLEKYPRTLEADLEMLKQRGCHAVFVPSVEQMYPHMPELKFNFGKLESVMEGAFRPGHFNGVGVVVSKLFNIVQPDYAYFGQKDLQQYMIINRLVDDLSFGLQLRRVPIFREDNGLAMSSRNRRLSANGKKQALTLYKSLQLAETMLKAGDSPADVQVAVEKLFASHEVKIEYIETVGLDTLEPVKNISDAGTVAVCVAGYVEDVRLIDNVIIKLDF